MTIIKRDSLGRILPGGKVLSSEDATNQGKMRKGKKEKLTSASQLLQDAGYPDPEDAPERKKLMAQEAAKGNVPAIRSFATKDELKAEVQVGYPAPGERCPTCQQYVLADMQITDDEMDSVIDGLDL